MTLKERIKLFCNQKNIPISRFEKEAGLSNGYFNQVKKRPSTDKLESIFRAFPDLNSEWLLTGDGPMLKNEAQQVKAPKISYGAHIKNLFSNSTDEEIESLIAGEFAKHLLEMYEEGRAYPAIYVSQYQDEIETLKNELTAAQRQIVELEKEIEILKN